MQNAALLCLGVFLFGISTAHGQDDVTIDPTLEQSVASDEVDATADGEDVYTAGKTKKAPKREPKAQAETTARRDSREPTSGRIADETTLPATVRDWRLKLQLSTGYVSTGSNNATEQANRDNAKYNRQALGGFSADFQYKKFFGAEFDFNYSQGNTRQVTSIDRITGTVTPRDRSMSQYGGMFDVQARYPVDIGKMKFIPKVGLGYGVQQVKMSTPVQGSGSPEGSKVNVTAPYAVFGGELALLPRLALNADYAITLSGGGSGTTTNAAGAGTSTDFTSSRFDRFRIGLAYEVSTPFLIGLQYARRQVRSTLPAAAEDIETTDQFLATFAVVL